MFAFGVAVTEDEIFRDCAGPGIELAAEPDTEALVHGAVGSIFRSYNMLLDQAAAHERFDDLEALVLIHQDAGIEDPDFLPKIREALSDPEVAIVGCAGAIDVRSIAWWEGSVTWASFTHRFDEYGGGEIAGLSWVPDQMPVQAQTGEVESVDGFVMAFSPWAIRNLRFDEQIGGALHGYDFDICMQARAAGKKVVTADLKVVHHHSLKLITEVEKWIETHIHLAEKWQEITPQPTGDWRQRARRAEAELAATRLTAGAGELIWEHRVRELERKQAAFEASLSWRITAPLRWVKRILTGGGRTPEEQIPTTRPPAVQPLSPEVRARRTSSREKAGLPR